MGINVGLDVNGLEIRPGATEAFGPPIRFVDYLCINRVTQCAKATY